MFGFLKSLFSSGEKKKTVQEVKPKEVASQFDGQRVLLNCQNLNCPMPIVKISMKFKEMKTGEVLEVTATDPAFKADLEAWVRKTGHELVQFDDKTIKTAILRKTVNA